MRKQPRNDAGLAFPLAVRPPHRLPLWRVPVNGPPLDMREIWVAATNEGTAIEKVRSLRRYKTVPLGVPMRGLDERTIPYCGGEE